MGREERFTGEESGAWGEDCGMHGGAWRKLSKGFRGIEIGVMTAQCVWWRHFKSEDFESEIEGREDIKWSGTLNSDISEK